MSAEPSIPSAAVEVSPGRTVADVAIVLLLIATVIGIRAGAPSNTYAYAQVWQVGVAIDVGENGNWLAPRDQKGALARKPQLLPWVTGPLLAQLGVYNDFTFRLPSLAAAMLMGVLVYSLGRRWSNRRVGLLAACLWATCAHMGRLSYMATTDMTLTLWMTAAIACVDRVLWHRAQRRRWLWVMGFYASMILAGLAKGWGMVNWPVMAVMIALAVALQPQPRRLLLRWWRAVRAIHLWWGVLAFVAAMGGLMVAMNAAAGNDISEVFEFMSELMGFEVGQRITGGGDSPPRPTSVPPILQLIYFTLPMSILAIGALVLEKPRRWLTGQSEITLPLCWIVAVVLPFSLAHGFRPDYLLPCYAAVAIMAAWAVDRVAQLGAGDKSGMGTCLPVGTVLPMRPGGTLPPEEGEAAATAGEEEEKEEEEEARQQGQDGPATHGQDAHATQSDARRGGPRKQGAGAGRLVITLRHVFAAAPVLIAGMLIVVPLLYLLGERLPEWLRLAQPYRVSPIDRRVLVGLIPAGAVMLTLAIAWSRKWKVRQFTLLACAGMLGVLFIEGNFISRHARTGDGDKMVAFARQVRDTIGDDEFLVLMAEKLTVELHLARFGEVIVGGDGAANLDHINTSGVPWLITTDQGLVQIGAAMESPDGGYRIKVAGEKRWFVTKPEDLGGPGAGPSGEIHERNSGRMHLIRLAPRPVSVSGKPIDTGYISGDWDDAN